MGFPPKFKFEKRSSKLTDDSWVAVLHRCGEHFFATGGTYHHPVFLHSPNGRTFHSCTTPSTSGLRGHHVVHLHHIVAVGEYGSIHITKDLGLTWQNVSTSETSSCIYRMAAMGNQLLAGDGHGGLLASSDLGYTWRTVAKRDGRLLDIYIDGMRALCVGNSANMLVYENGNSRTISLPCQAAMTKTLRTPGGALLMVGDAGEILRSTDNGEHWVRIQHSFELDIEDAAVVQGRLILVGTGGAILYSDDDGLTYSALHSGSRVKLWSILPVPDGAYLGSDKGEIFFLHLDVETAGVQKAGAAPIDSKDPKQVALSMQ